MRIAICDDEVASQERTVSYVEDYISEKKTDVEYEYLFINGDFDIDMIMSKTKSV